MSDPQSEPIGRLVGTDDVDDAITHDDEVAAASPTRDPGERPGPLDPGEEERDLPRGTESYERPGDDSNYEQGSTT